MSASEDYEEQEDTATTVPSVLITSCDIGFNEQDLIKQILGTTSLPEPSKQEDTVVWYPWTINNKYYTADVSLCVVPSTYQMTSEIAQSMQAFIAYFDSTVKDGLERLSPWISVVEDLAPEVLILVCDRVCESGVSRHEAHQWCLAHAFELVELSPEDLPDEEDDFPESTGVKRIVQALNANVWSSVEMKDEHSGGFGLMSSLVASRHNNPRPRQDTPPPSSSLPVEGVVDSGEPRRTEPNPDNRNTQVDTIVDPMLDLDIQELANLTAGDADVENFERLFTKLKEMKDKALWLPPEQRKLHAEKVAKAFWTAIGGDQDEIEGLSSGEES
ncbi:alpha- and gamma-adaptin-binding protein p34 [Oncorhynchus tshawytscha]|uniref:Alpha-and gamma-adaptin-binding protein p34 n=1 Tax=Oncorhynchus tshawytscha TaxID=74940 RepID=A0AAZ3RMX6_ONCTS|nr:alpha- and gamma-adaptin-binding protein p34 [Oncorhynchus tshawytscha]XP_042167561.1 alpha- and gamma-adaptin-binding protein p34 [Oncorhynchus tshawytscha]XP_042167900.1 alpha- and gamma-adaptin-binding protein p34 [Oncorhynchus tshawytscha]XP_042168189.1 alpha- and gamma-adaptin-binding protein p34 [Oncorhynchus tshawytscha]